MSHETPQQRYRRLRRDPLRGAQIAPLHTVQPVRCVCGHAELMHRRETDDRCLSYGCDCTEYREA
jgi:hypothetical protein